MKLVNCGTLFIVVLATIQLAACGDDSPPADNPAQEIECTVADDCIGGDYDCIDSKCVERSSLESILQCGPNKVDCTQAEGWSAGTCQDGVCVAQACDTSGFYLSSATQTCVPNDDKHCGAEDNACPSDKLCSLGHCADKCIESEIYCTVDSVGGCYPLNSLAHCGACNEACAPENAAHASCEEGVCKVIDCNAGFHLSESGSCEVDTDQACGAYGEDCTKIMGWKDGDCVNGACKPNQCDVDFHLYNGECEADSVSACGISRENCAATEGWLDGECLYGRCSAFECVNGYHDDNGLCVEDTLTKCGDALVDCTKTPGWYRGECLYGRCQVTQCWGVGWHFGADGSCEENSETVCGMEYDVVDCTQMPGWVSGECGGGNECRPHTCDTENYYLDEYMSVCYPNDTNNCGEKGRKCNSGENCIKGRCLQLSCESNKTACTLPSGALACINTHMNNDHCGGCNEKCEASMFANASTAFCGTGNYCRVGQCKPGYIYEVSRTGTCVEAKPFVFTVDVPPAASSASKRDYQVRWNTSNQNVRQLRIDCGTHGVASNSNAIECSLSNEVRTHTISIYGDIQNISMCTGLPNNVVIRDIQQWGEAPWQSLRGMFQNCQNVRIVAPDVPNFTQVTDASNMFAYSQNVQLSANMWNNTSAPISFASMFKSASGINSALGQWNTSHVVSMESMFQDAQTFNQNIGAWDVRNVKNMALMFYYANEFNQPIGNWKLDNLENTNLMFYHARAFSQPISNWRMPKLRITMQMFASSYYSEVIDGWDLRQISTTGSDSASMFQSVMCHKLQNIIFPAGKDKRDFYCL